MTPCALVRSIDVSVFTEHRGRRFIRNVGSCLRHCKCRNPEHSTCTAATLPTERPSHTHTPTDVQVKKQLSFLTYGEIGNSYSNRTRDLQIALMAVSAVHMFGGRLIFKPATWHGSNEEPEQCSSVQLFMTGSCSSADFLPAE